MFCPQCGHRLADGADRCVDCGFVFPHAPVSTDIGQDPTFRMLLPVGRSVWAILAGYAGLLSPLVLPAPFAILFGVLAIVDIKKHPDRHGMGRAIFGIVMGVPFSVLFVLCVVAFIATR
jgi:hypothetical protein